MGVPLVIIHFNGAFHYKASILGYPYFGKPPYIKDYQSSSLKVSEVRPFKDDSPYNPLTILTCAGPTVPILPGTAFSGGAIHTGAVGAIAIQ